MTAFFVGQGSVQLLNLLTGFLLLRWLSVSEYAWFSLVNGFQSTVALLVDLGLSGSIVALLAGRTDEQVVGRYIRSVRHLRLWLFAILVPAIILAFVALATRQGMGPLLTTVLLGGIVTSLYFQTWTAAYSVPLLVHQKLRLYYRVPTLLGALRLLVSFGLHMMATLTAWMSVCISALNTLAQGWCYRREAAPQVAEPASSDPETNREVLGYIRPMIPGSVFFALQGQITIYIISWFGQTSSIAEVGALGRLAQLFVLLTAFNSVVIAPNIAKLPAHMLPRRYMQVLAGAVGISLSLLATGFLVPDWLLWLLGKKYAHLRPELVWMLGAACIDYISGCMWTMHSARRWVFSWCVWAYIGVVLSVQILGVSFMNLSTTHSVLVFSLGTAAATNLVHWGWAIYGFCFHKERTT